MSRRKPSLRGDAERNALVVANLGLVGHVLRLMARRYGMPEAADDADLYQSGVLGLMRAAEIYEAGRGVRFGTFACRVIFDRVMKGLRRTEFIWVPEHIRGDRRAEIRARLKPLSLDTTPGGRGRSDGWDRAIEGDAVAAFVPDRDRSSGLARYDLERVLAHCRTDRQRQVLLARARGETFGQISARIGLSKQRVYQIQAEAFRAIRRAAAAGVDFEAE